MAKIAIQGNPAGTGTITFQPPNTNTNRTVSLPDVDGTLVMSDQFIPVEEHINDGLKHVGHNYIVDGAFDFWYEGTSQTNSGYGSDTMWLNSNTGSTKTHSRQSFALGAMFPDMTPCPEYFSRTIVSTVAGVSNNVIKIQNVEDVATLAGKKATISFYAKTDAIRNISVELVQRFGTGGSPSANVTNIGMRKIPITTVWAKYTVTADIPAITGKVVGSNNDDTLSLYIWFDAGSNLNARTDSLGQQSGTFDLALVKLEEGEVATPYVRDVGYELQRVQRYYEEGIFFHVGYNIAASNIGSTVKYAVVKRGTPIITQAGLSVSNCNTTPAISNTTTESFLSYRSVTGTGAAQYNESWKADARL